MPYRPYQQDEDDLPQDRDPVPSRLSSGMMIICSVFSPGRLFRSMIYHTYAVMGVILLFLASLIGMMLLFSVFSSIFALHGFGLPEPVIKALTAPSNSPMAWILILFSSAASVLLGYFVSLLLWGLASLCGGWSEQGFLRSVAILGVSSIPLFILFSIAFIVSKYDHQNAGIVSQTVLSSPALLILTGVVVFLLLFWSFLLLIRGFCTTFQLSRSGSIGFFFLFVFLLALPLVIWRLNGWISLKKPVT